MDSSNRAIRTGNDRGHLPLILAAYHGIAVDEAPRTGPGTFPGIGEIMELILGLMLILPPAARPPNTFG